MCEDVHHGIEDDGRGGVLSAHVLRQLHDAVRLATETADRGGVVQGIARDGESQVTPESRYALALPPVVVGDVALHDTAPRPCVDGIDHEPDADDGYEPVACITQVLPQLGETDVECQHHHHNCGNTTKEEYVVKSLFRQFHCTSSF